MRDAVLEATSRTIAPLVPAWAFSLLANLKTYTISCMRTQSADSSGPVWSRLARRSERQLSAAMSDTFLSAVTVRARDLHASGESSGSASSLPCDSEEGGAAASITKAAELKERAVELQRVQGHLAVEHQRRGARDRDGRAARHAGHHVIHLVVVE